MTDQSKENTSIREQAASWAVSLDAGQLSSEERRDLAAWLKQSPQHVDEFLAVCAVFDVLSDTEYRGAIDLAELMDPLSQPVISLEAEKIRRGFIARNIRGLGAVAAAFLVAMVSFALLRDLAPVTQAEPVPLLASTGLGEAETLTLADGSTLSLNTSTALSVTLSDDARTIFLSEGEVFADVASEPDRPFRILAGATPVEALGTAFNARYLNGELRVDVSEGVVLVGAGGPIDRDTFRESLSAGPVLLEDGRVLLAAGQWVSLDTSKGEPQFGQTDLDRIAAWRDGRLVFENTSLSDVAAEFNRYNQTRLVVADPDLGDERVSAVFDARDPESLVASLELTGRARAVRRDGEIRLEAN